MQQILQNVLGTDSEDVCNLVKQIKERVVLALSPQENATVDYLLSCYTTLGTFPTKEIFLTKFPEYGHALKEKKPLEAASFQYYVHSYIFIKSKQIVAKRLLEFSTQVLAEGSSGFTWEMVESLRDSITEDSDNGDEESDDVLELYALSKKRNLNGGIKTYVEEIDELTGGIEAGTVAVVTGFTGGGKTTFALNMAYKNARDGHSVVYITLEVSKRDILYNLISLHSLDPKFKGRTLQSRSIRSRELNEEQESRFTEIATDFNEHILPNVRILTETDFKTFSQGEVRDKLYRLDDEKPLEALFLDQANLLKFYSKGKFSNVGDSINEFVSFFRRLSLCFRKDGGDVRQIATIMLAQCNRQGWLKARNQKKPEFEGKYDTTALAEANELERCASYIITVYSSDEMKLVEEARVQLLKSRFGQTHENPITVTFRPQYSLMGDMSETPRNMTGANIFDSLLNLNPNDFGFGMISNIGGMEL